MVEVWIRMTQAGSNNPKRFFFKTGYVELCFMIHLVSYIQMLLLGGIMFGASALASAAAAISAPAFAVVAAVGCKIHRPRS